MPATYASRTYSKRSNLKRRSTPEIQPNSDEEHDDSHSETSRKRQKVLPGKSLSHISARPTTPTMPNPETNSEDEHVKPSVKVTYSTPRKQPPKQRSATPELRPVSPALVSPKKLARDLSGIFASAIPSTSRNKALRKPPTKLAKRMLSRSKTEPYINSQTAIDAQLEHRMPSLPALATGSLYGSQPMSLSQPSPTTEATEDSSAVPIVPLPIPVSNSNTTRTYAGKSRSFLVAMPTSSLSLSEGTSLDESQSQSQSALDDEDDFLTRESYSSLRERWGVDNSEDDPYPLSASPSPKGKGKERQRPPPVPLPNGMMNPLKSITELRSKGESRRFLDEVGYLFEGMAGSGAVGLRRASALEITTKLCDPDFARKARAADFFGKTWDVFIEAGAGKGEDKVLDILLAFLAALVAREPSSLAELAQRTPSSHSTNLESPSPTKTRKRGKERIPEEQAELQTQLPPLQSFVDTLFILLDSFRALDPLILAAPKSELGDAELRKVGIGKKDKITLASIYNLIATKSDIFAADTAISTILLLVNALQALPPSLLDKSYLPSLLASLRTTISSSSAVTNTASSLASLLYLIWKDAPSRVPYESVQFHLRLLDTYLLKQWGDERSLGESQSQGQSQNQEDENGATELECEERNEKELDKAREEWLVGELIALGVCAELKIQGASEDTDAESASAGKCLQFSLRVLVSLTYSDERWGKKVLENEYAVGWLMRIITSTSGMSRNGGVKKEEEDTKMKDKGSEDEKLYEAYNGREEYVEALDRLCLALGLLTNLVQVVSGTKDILRETRMDPACILRKRACVRLCTCSNAISVLDILTRLYKQQLSSTSPNSPVKKETDSMSPEPDTSPSEVDAAYLRGHLSILFGLLMRDNKKNQSAILSALPVPSDTIASSSLKTSSRVKLNMLVEHARDFVGLYAVLSANSRMEESEDSKVATEVVVFLEDLRDN